MPRDLLNTNPAYGRLIAGMTPIGNTLDWANVLSSFGLPGTELIHQLVFALESDNQYW